MRKDFNKVLTECPRIGHRRSFKAQRRAKQYDLRDEDGNPVLRREGMRFRYDWFNDERKEFGEHLGPLRRFLRSAVGRRWDDVYSEICQSFDRRKVINDHIFQHLFSDVDVDTYLASGVPYVRRTHGPDRPCVGWSTYYIDPRDGVLRSGRTDPYAPSHKSLRRAAHAAEKAAVYRRIDRDNELRLIDGVWYQFVWCDLPAPTASWERPAAIEAAEWDAMGKEARRDVGVRVERPTAVADTLTGQAVWAGMSEGARYGSFYDRRTGMTYGSAGPHQPGRYRAEKRSPSRKTLRDAGLVGSS